ncbi:hypothetical protein [Streptomyces griseus]|uniref:hypothetical protein n=1 Tax=Streptomyces griseus TaxID=1911 RepID=UPI0005615E04|nr:hypothetical protein [Streptomyces griseus]
MDSGAIRRWLALGTSVFTASAILALASPATAHAAPTQCEGRKVRTLTFSTGSVKIYKQGGYLCAITVPKDPGTHRRMTVSVHARGLHAVEDTGLYAYRAGPVTVHVGHQPVLISGRVGRDSKSTGWTRF